MPLTEADSAKAHATACDAIQDRVRDRVGPKCVVFFAAYGLDADQLPIANLDVVPITGKVVIRGSRIHGIQRSADYESPIMESPSWLDLCVIANDQIATTRDRIHRYLEHIEIVELEDDTQIASFRFGG
jgi:hypothetical protein